MATRPVVEKRGPKIGDAASLWNFTPSPGFSKEEAHILRLLLMKLGVGKWVQILETGLLPGKLIQQLNGQTQRLLGQQSLAAFTGLQVDIDRVRADNEARTDAPRKAGLIINTGPNLTKEMKEKLQEEARAKYGLTPEQIREAEEQLEEIAAAMAANTNAAAGEAATASASVAATMGDPTTMDKEGKVAMLRALHARLASLQATLQQHSAAKAEAAQPSTSDQENLVANAPTGTHAAVPPTTVATAVAKQSKGSARGRGKGPSKVTAGSKRRAAIAAADGDDDDFMDGGDEEMVDASAAALSADVATLTAMGFGERQARDALEEADGNIDMAAEWLMTHCV